MGKVLYEGRINPRIPILARKLLDQECRRREAEKGRNVSHGEVIADLILENLSPQNGHVRKKPALAAKSQNRKTA